MNAVSGSTIPSDLAARRVQDAVRPTPGEDRTARLREAAQEFEAVFVNLMLGAMRKTVQKDERFSGGPAEGTFQALLDQEFALGAARQGRGLGIGEMLFRSLERHVNRSDDPASRVDVQA